MPSSFSRPADDDVGPKRQAGRVMLNGGGTAEPGRSSGRVEAFDRCWKYRRPPLLVSDSQTRRPLVMTPYQDGGVGVASRPPRLSPDRTNQNKE
jgi:hypothetical protein